ncbi:MAG TPA: proline dehydrogenase family protein [Flavobacteriales bacterium]|nr:proline dehydrogenase family protein [Flavobacteriales bacterium]
MPNTTKVSFENTEIAFKNKSDRELKKAWWLFKIVASPFLVKMGRIFAKPALYLGFKPLFKKTIFKQFCGGENIEECEKTIEQLGKFNIGTILDYSVEGETSEENLDHTKKEIILTTQKAKGNKNIPFCVFKVTGVVRFEILEKVSAGVKLSAEEEEEWKRGVKRVEEICFAAAGAQTPIFIDAEESWIQQAIDDLATEMMKRINKTEVIIFNTYQLYRHDRLAYLKREVEAAKTGGYKVGAKLVRGAYMEKERKRAEERNYPSPIQPDKASSDRDYDAALEYCVKHIDTVSICAGSHNEKSSLKLTELMAANAIAPNDKRIYFAQLLGMSDHISYNLADAGYNVAKYVPYGPVKEVLPYLIRRAQENTSVKGQTGRELGLIIKERERRKKIATAK